MPHSVAQRIETALVFRQFIQEKYPERHSDARLFFTEDPRDGYYRPEFATFFDVTTLKGVRGIKINHQYWRSVEHYFQARKLEYIIGDIDSDTIETLQQLFLHIVKADDIFTFVRTPMTPDSMAALLAGFDDSCPKYSVQYLAYQEALTALGIALLAKGNPDINHCIRRCWHTEKEDIMEAALSAKYEIPELKNLLSQCPKHAIIVEGNLFDRHWGVRGKDGQLGSNRLGDMTYDIWKSLEKEASQADDASDTIMVYS